MKIELKQIRVNERMSEETFCFDANLYINNVKAGIAYNEGHGGATSFRATSPKGRELIEQAESYCESLPDKVYPEYELDGSALTEKMNLENFLDDLVNDYVSHKDLIKFHTKMHKNMEDSIVVGVPEGKEYGTYRLQFPLDMCRESEKHANYLSKYIAGTVIPALKENEKILNYNIPDKVMQKMGTNHFHVAESTKDYLAQKQVHNKKQNKLS